MRKSCRSDACAGPSTRDYLSGAALGRQTDLNASVTPGPCRLTLSRPKKVTSVTPSRPRLRAVSNAFDLEIFLPSASAARVEHVPLRSLRVERGAGWTRVYAQSEMTSLPPMCPCSGIAKASSKSTGLLA